MKQLCFIFLALVSVIAMTCCTSRKVARSLTEVENVIDERPDSALALLMKIDTTAIRSRAGKAEWSLLMSMALDKNYIDTATTRIITPAVNWYKRRGTADQKMKSFFYLGRVQSNAGNNEEAIIALTMAKEYSAASKDKRFRGLICGALADLYRKCFLFQRQLEELQESQKCFSSAGDKRRSDLTLGRLAMAYQDLNRWPEADSLYSVALTRNAKDTFAMRSFLSNSATMNMILPEPDFNKSIDLFTRLAVDYKTSLASIDLTCFAFAEELKGNHSACDEIISLCEQPDDYWMFRILYNRKKNEEAIESLNRIYSKQDTVVRSMLSNSISNSLNDYYGAEAASAKQASKIDRMMLMIVTLASLILVSVIISLARRRLRKADEEKMKMRRLADEADRMAADTRAEYDRELSGLRNAFAKLHKERFSSLKSLCDLYLSTKRLNSRKDRIYAKVESIISFINTDEDSWKSFESKIDRSLDGIVTKLRTELNGVSETDVKLFCYSIIRLDGESISSITGLTTSNLYSRKSRLKDRILTENPPHKEEFLMFF